MTTPNYANEEAAAEESANDTYRLFQGEIAKEYIRIKARERALQIIRDEEAVGFEAEFESKIVDAAHIQTPDQQSYLVKKLIYLPGVTMLHSEPGVGKSICAMDLAFASVWVSPSGAGTRSSGGRGSFISSARA
jgi:hypothetical protein